MLPPPFPIALHENPKILLQTFKNSYSSHTTSLPEKEVTWDSNSVPPSCQSSPVIAEFASSQQKKWIRSAAPRTSRQTIPTIGHSTTFSWYHEALITRSDNSSSLSLLHNHLAHAPRRTDRQLYSRLTNPTTRKSLLSYPCYDKEYNFRQRRTRLARWRYARVLR